jgi:hypothetical protein
MEKKKFNAQSNSVSEHLLLSVSWALPWHSFWERNPYKSSSTYPSSLNLSSTLFRCVVLSMRGKVVKTYWCKRLSSASLVSWERSDCILSCHLCQEVEFCHIAYKRMKEKSRLWHTSRMCWRLLFCSCIKFCWATASPLRAASLLIIDSRSRSQ